MPKNYNYNSIRNQVIKIVKKTNDSYQNKYQDTVWDYHILAVINHSLTLGKKLKADLEVLELAALLHDYSALLNHKFQKKHHLHSARLAQQILKKLGYPQNKIEQVKHCILSHRSSVKIKRKTLEAKILASADAMSHITELADMFLLTFRIHKYQTLEGSKWLKAKLKRSWKKIIPQGKKLVKEDYKIAMRILDKAIK